MHSNINRAFNTYRLSNSLDFSIKFIESYKGYSKIIIKPHFWGFQIVRINSFVQEII